MKTKENLTHNRYSVCLDKKIIEKVKKKLKKDNLSSLSWLIRKLLEIYSDNKITLQIMQVND